jgi:hypothetical protein
MIARYFPKRVGAFRLYSRPIRSFVALAAVVIATAFAGCARTPPRFAGPDPSDPLTPVRPAAYRSVVAPYTSQRPVEPSPWRDQNDRVAPAPRP